MSTHTTDAPTGPQRPESAVQRRTAQLLDELRHDVPPILDEEQVASLLRVSVSTVRRMRDSGRITAMRARRGLGRSRRMYSRLAVAEAIARLEVEAQAETAEGVSRG